MSVGKDKKIALMLAALMLAALILSVGCQGPSRAGYQGGAVGGAVGATAGALLDSDNRWRGGVIGGALGAVLGGAVTEISSRASREAVHHQQPVAYQSQDGSQRVVAQPGPQYGRCQKVVEKYYERGQLVKVTEREVCP